MSNNVRLLMRFMLLHNRHHKGSRSVPFFIHCKTVTILLRIRVRGHFVMSITNNHESYYVTVLDNPLSNHFNFLESVHFFRISILFFLTFPNENCDKSSSISYTPLPQFPMPQFPMPLFPNFLCTLSCPYNCC